MASPHDSLACTRGARARLTPQVYSPSMHNQPVSKHDIYKLNLEKALHKKIEATQREEDRSYIKGRRYKLHKGKKHMT